MTAREPIAWAGRTVFWVRCKCRGRFRSEARIVIGDKGPQTVTRVSCPHCGHNDTAMEISTEEHKG